MKGEYSNLFTVSLNPSTNEVIIIFKQETGNPIFNNREFVSDSSETIELSKIILNIDNAVQLKNTLTDCFNNLEKNKEK